MQYLKLLLLYSLIYSVTTEQEFNCKEILAETDSTCVMHPSIISDYYNITCPLSETESLRVFHEPETNHLKVMCTDIIDNRLKFIDARTNSKYRLEIRNVKTYMVEKCMLPEEFRGALEAFKIKTLLNLKIKGNLFGNSTLKRRFFSGFAASLERLRIMESNLVQIDYDSFSGMTNLISLDLYGNKLKRIDNQFAKLYNLVHLNLAGNEISVLSPSVFDDLPKLCGLYLSGNQLRQLPAGIFNNVNDLTFLQLDNNKLELDSSTFEKLTYLSDINLSYNNLKALPDDLFKNNRALTSIRIGRNKFATLPNGLFSNFTFLKRIEVNYCSLQTLQENLFNNSPKIRTINLQYNNITTLPHSIFNNLTKLQKLYLNNNNLKDLPAQSFRDLLSLKELHLSNNNLQKITRNVLKGVYNITKFICGHNNLTSIELNAFANKKQLREIDLSHNQLKLDDFYETQPFNGCEKLEILNLTHNVITFVIQDVSLLNLKKLNLSNNNITKLNVASLQNISGKLHLDVRNNSINEINLSGLETFAKSPNNTLNSVVYVHNKAITCDCKAYHLLNYFNHLMVPDVYSNVEFKAADKLLCAGPGKLAGVKVATLHPEIINCPAYPCPHNCDCTQRPHKNIILMDCSARNLTEVPPVFFIKQYKRIEIYLQDNFIKEAPRSAMGYEMVNALNLSNNMIQTVNWVPPKVQILNLHNNNISSLSYEALSSLRSTTTLHGNPWICDCNPLNLSYYVKDNIIPMKENITCKSSNLALSTLSEKDLCPTQEALILIIVFAAALIITIPSVIAALYYKYDDKIKIWLYAHNLFLSFVTEEDIDKDKQYNAFISFSHVDDDFVLNQLVPNLENGPNPFKLCIHMRNWIPGEFIETQVTDSVKNSRRTLIILSQSFLDSVWGQMEFRTAYLQALSDGCRRVIIILLGEVEVDNANEELKMYLKTNTYIKWGDPWFWDKLRYALPHYKRMKKAKFDNVSLDKLNIQK